MVVDLIGKYKVNFSDKDIITDLDDIEDIIKYYYLYNYTDDINIISNNPQYPSMLNYIKTGLLTEEEMLQALLHE